MKNFIGSAEESIKNGAKVLGAAGVMAASTMAAQDAEAKDPQCRLEVEKNYGVIGTVSGSMEKIGNEVRKQMVLVQNSPVRHRVLCDDRAGLSMEEIVKKYVQTKGPSEGHFIDFDPNPDIAGKEFVPQGKRDLVERAVQAVLEGKSWDSIFDIEEWELKAFGKKVTIRVKVLANPDEVRMEVERRKREKEIGRVEEIAKSGKDNNLEIDVTVDPRADYGTTMANFSVPVWRPAEWLQLEAQFGGGAGREFVEAIDRDQLVLIRGRAAIAVQLQLSLGNAVKLFAEPSIGIEGQVANERVEKEDGTLDNGLGVGLHTGAMAGIKIKVSDSANLKLGGGVNVFHGDDASVPDSGPTTRVSPVVNAGVEVKY